MTLFVRNRRINFVDNLILDIITKKHYSIQNVMSTRVWGPDWYHLVPRLYKQMIKLLRSWAWAALCVVGQREGRATLN